MAAKKKSKPKKQSVIYQLWEEATPLRKSLYSLLTLVVLLGSVVLAWGNIRQARDNWYIERYGVAPHASDAKLKEVEKFMDMLAQYSASEINSRQIGRQIEMDRLAYKCNMGRCTQYDLSVLNNLKAEWHREQQLLEQMRRQQQTQQQQYQQQYQMRR